MEGSAKVGGGGEAASSPLEVFFCRQFVHILPKLDDFSCSESMKNWERLFPFASKISGPHGEDRFDKSLSNSARSAFCLNIFV